MSDSGDVRLDREIAGLPEGALKLLGFCRRSGRIVCGAGQVLSAVSGKRPPGMVVIASDASYRTVKQVCDKCDYRGIKVARTSLTGGELARLLGKTGCLMAVGSADPAISAQIVRMLENSAEQP